MAVAAANKSWLPRIFGLVGRVRPPPPPLAPTTPDGGEPPASSSSKSSSDAPINALVLSAALSAFYVLLGNFRALLTFNGLGEYTFFFLTVVGALVLRYREPHLKRPYKPPILTPVIFAVVSGFVVVRGAVFAPVQAAVLAGVWVVGLAFYWAKWLIWLRRQ
jgi:L-type amino acid transporter 9